MGMDSKEPADTFPSLLVFQALSRSDCTLGVDVLNAGNTLS